MHDVYLIKDLHPKIYKELLKLSIRNETISLKMSKIHIAEDGASKHVKNVHHHLSQGDTHENNEIPLHTY